MCFDLRLAYVFGVHVLNLFFGEIKTACWKNNRTVFGSNRVETALD